MASYMGGNVWRVIALLTKVMHLPGILYDTSRSHFLTNHDLDPTPQRPHLPWGSLLRSFVVTVQF